VKGNMTRMSLLALRIAVSVERNESFTFSIARFEFGPEAQKKFEWTVPTVLFQADRSHKNYGQALACS